MKKYYVFLLSIILYSCGSVPNLSRPEYSELVKTNYNFSVQNNDLAWQKVYDSERTSNQLIEDFIKSGVFNNFNTDQNSIFGELKPFAADYKSAGYGEMMTPIYIARSFFGAHCMIEFKEDRYRVTLTDIYAVQKYSDPLTEMGELTDLKRYAVENNNLIERFLGPEAHILNYTFEKHFIISEHIDQW